MAIPVTAPRRCLPPSTSWRESCSAAARSATGPERSSACRDAVEATVPPGKAIHAILVNVAHKHPKVRALLARHRSFTFHFTPTSASWLNAAEGFLSALTRRRLRRGSFTGVVDLLAAIERSVATHDRRAKSFLWTKPATGIIGAISRSPEPSV